MEPVSFLQLEEDRSLVPRREQCRHSDVIRTYSLSPSPAQVPSFFLEHLSFVNVHLDAFRRHSRRPPCAYPRTVRSILFRFEYWLLNVSRNVSRFDVYIYCLRNDRLINNRIGDNFSRNWYWFAYIRGCVFLCSNNLDRPRASMGEKNDWSDLDAWEFNGQTWVITIRILAWK